MAQDNFSIVIVGKMNPALHHPWWYQSLKVIDEEEFNSALNSPNTLVSPSITQVEYPAFSIKCQQDRWEINAPQRDKCERLATITSKVFEVLDQTPVSAFGFNVHLHIDTNVEDVALKLAELVESWKLPLPEDDGPRRGTFSYQIGTDARRRTIRAEVSALGDQKIYVHQNIHYAIREQGVDQYFNIGDLLQPRFASDCDEAIELANQFAASV